MKSWSMLLKKRWRKLNQVNGYLAVAGTRDKWDSISGVVARGFPTHELLSEVSPENPVFLKHASGHASLVNQYAMEMAGIEKNTPSPDGGETVSYTHL